MIHLPYINTDQYSFFKMGDSYLMSFKQRITSFSKSVLIASIIFSVSPVSAEIIQHPYVLIPFVGELTQDTKLTENEWKAIIIALNHSMDRVKAAVVAVDRKNFNEARSIIINSLDLLTLVKIATPTFEIVNQTQSGKSIIKISSLLIKIQDPNGEPHIVDILLMKSNLENALRAIEAKDADLVRLFLVNASKSSWRYEK